MLKLEQIIRLMRVGILLYFVLFCLGVQSQTRQWTKAEVTDIIKKVNSYWQTNHPAEVRAFWDNAAYHTGNMEVVRLLREESGELS